MHVDHVGIRVVRRIELIARRLHETRDKKDCGKGGVISGGVDR